MDYERLISLLLTDPHRALNYIDAILMMNYDMSLDGIFFSATGVIIVLLSMYAFQYALMIKPALMLINWIGKSIISLIIHLNTERLVSAY